MPSKTELDTLKNIFRHFLWAKNVEGSGHSSKVGWDKVIQDKSRGGLGLTDPALKAKCMHAQWILRAIGPGSPPWLGLVMHRLQQCRPSPTGPRHLCFILSDSPRMIRGSSLWNHMWASFDDIREQLEWHAPSSRAEVLALPLAHHSWHWREGAVQLFKRPGCVAKLWQQRLRCFGDCWLQDAERWLSVSELQGRGLPTQLAAEVHQALTCMISPGLSQAMDRPEHVGVGSWVADVDGSAAEFRLDSALCVQTCRDSTLEGIEYTVDEQTWMMSRFAVEEDEPMSFPRDISKAITVLYGKGKQKFALASEIQESALTRLPVFWHELTATEFVVVNPAMWFWPCLLSSGGGTSRSGGASPRSLLNHVLVDIYRREVRRRIHMPVGSICAKWDFGRRSFGQSMSIYGPRRTPPKSAASFGFFFTTVLSPHADTLVG